MQDRGPWGLTLDTPDLDACNLRKSEALVAVEQWHLVILDRQHSVQVVGLHRVIVRAPITIRGEGTCSTWIWMVFVVSAHAWENINHYFMFESICVAAQTKQSQISCLYWKKSRILGVFWKSALLSLFRLLLFFFIFRAQWLATVWQVGKLKSHSAGEGLDSRRLESGDLLRWTEW